MKQQLKLRVQRTKHQEERAYKAADPRHVVLGTVNHLEPVYIPPNQRLP